MRSRLGVFALVVALIALGAVTLIVAMRLKSSRPMHANGGAHLLVYDVPGDIDESAPVFNGFSLGALRRDRQGVAHYDLYLAFISRRNGDSLMPHFFSNSSKRPVLCHSTDMSCISLPNGALR